MDKTAIYYDNIFGKEHSSLKLDLYEPNTDDVPADKKFPLLVYIHGGFWMDRDKSEYISLGRYWASQGIMVAIVNYRLSKRAHKSPMHYPSHNNDVASALRWLIANPDEFRYDVNNITLMGHSCGAHTISLIAMQQNKYLSELSGKYKINAIVGIQGIYDCPQLAKDFPSYVDNFSFVFNSDKPEDWESPQLVNHSAGNDDVSSIKWMLVHAPTDDWVNLDQTKKFAEHLQKSWSANNVKIVDNVEGSHFEVVTKLGETDHTKLDGLRETIKNFIL